MTNGFFAGFALAIVLWFLAFLYLKAFVRRRTSPDYLLDLLQEEVRQLEADIDEKTEQNLQLLEEKIDSLRKICEEAERRITVYNRELEKHGSETRALAELNSKPLVERLTIKSAKTAEAAYRIETRKPHRQAALSKPAEQVVLQSDSAETKAPVQPAPINITKSREPLTFKPRPVKERIAELQKAGFAPELIAKRLDINLGEVQLYFNLAEKPE